MKRQRKIFTLLLVGIVCLGAGCSRGKDLESLNREQARVISEMKGEIARLHNELEGLKASRDKLAQEKLELEGKIKVEPTTKSLIK